MFYIFGQNGECIASCSALPNVDMLEKEGQKCIEDNRALPDITMLRLNGDNIEVFDPNDKEPSYEEVLKRLEQRLVDDRNELENEDILYKSKMYQVDEKSLNRLILAQNLEQEEIEWKTSDNTMYTLTKEDISNILNLVAKRNANIFTQISNAKDKINVIVKNKNEESILEDDAKNRLLELEKTLYYYC